MLKTALRSSTGNQDVGLRKGVTIIANTSGNVNTKVTGTLTTRNTVIIIGCTSDGASTSTIVTRVRTRNNDTVNIRTSVDRTTSIIHLFRAIGDRCNALSVLIGGTNITIFRVVSSLARRTFRGRFGLGILNCLLTIHRTLGLFNSSNDIVGVDSVLDASPCLTSDICSTAGNTISALAFTLTQRLNPHKVQIGSVLPKRAGAPTASNGFTNRLNRGLLTNAPLKHFNRPRSVTPLTIFLTSTSSR